MKSILAKLLMILGSSLLFLSMIGSFTSIGGYENNKPRTWERFDKSLVNQTHSIDDLVSEAKGRKDNFGALSDEQKMILLYEVVIDRFTHNGGARHTIFTNWILFFAGKIVSPLGIIWDPNIFVSKGHSLICSQSSYLLMQLALRNGIKARHVGLNGHVVMEAWYDNDWHLFDPDAEVMPKDNTGNILSVEELSKDIVKLNKEYPLIKGDFISIIASREDNSFVSYPVGAYFEWKSQVLFYFEKIVQAFKYMASLLIIAIGIYLQLTHNNRINSDA